MMDADRGPFLISAGALNSAVLVDAVSLAMTAPRYRVAILPREHERELLYQTTDLESDQAIQQLRDGVLASVRLTADEPEDVRSVMLFKPAFSGDSARLWSLHVEQAAGDPLPLFAALRAVPGFAYVALYSADDLVEVPEPVTVATFPWGDPWLIVAAVLDGIGAFVVRRGEAWPVIDREA